MHQTLAQNIVAHKRNFKGLVDLFEKVGAVFQRMQSLDKNIHKNLQDMDALMGDDNQNMRKMKEMVFETLGEVEKGAKSDIKESLEPVTPFLLRKKMEGELDDFIQHALTYMESSS
jgi:hypothetical protein